MARFRPLPKAFILTTLFALCLHISSLPAVAESRAGTPARAQALEAVISDMLDNARNHFARDDATLKTEGALLVEDSGSYFAVTLPHLSVIREDDSRTDIGIIAMNVMPGEVADEWKMTVAMPNPIISYAPDGTQTASLDIGAQTFAGIYSEHLGNFSRLNARYQNISLTESNLHARTSIPEIRISQNYTRDPQNLWSGQTEILITGLHTGFERSGAQASLGKVRMLMDLTRHNPEKFRDLSHRMDGLQERYRDQAAANLDTDDLGTLIEAIADFIAGSGDYSSLSMGIDNIAVLLPATATSSEQTIDLANINFSSAMGGFDTNDVYLELSFGLEGLKVTPQPEFFNNATPERLSLNIRFSDLPYNATIDGEPNGTGKTASELLSQARIDLRNTALGNELYTLSVNGQAVADPDAAHGLTGRMDVTIHGLQALIDALQTEMNKPDIEEARRKQAGEMMGMLTILQMTGQQDANNNGARTYNIGIEADGRILLNGTDLQMLTQMLGTQAR